MITFTSPAFGILAAISLYPLYSAYKSEEPVNRNVSLLQSLAIIVIGIAASGPAIETQKQVSSTPTITVLTDKSNSMKFIKNGDRFTTDKAEIKTKTIAISNNSEIKGQIEQLENNRPYLLISDLQNKDFEQALEKARSKNISLNMVKYGVKPEAAISIEGPETVTPGVRARFDVKLHKTAAIETVSKPEVIVEGEEQKLEKSGENTWSFTKEFDDKGYKSIRASIEADDLNKQNNKYYKTVEVRDKPKILIVGSKDSIVESTQKYFSFKSSEKVPDNLENYEAIVSKKQVQQSKITEFVGRGGGYVRTGRISRTNDILPIRPSSSESNQKSTTLMLLIDISISTEGQRIKQSKKIAYNLVDRLPPSARVGAIAYNDETYLMSEPKPLALNRQELKEGISRLPTEGPSRHGKALQRGRESLNQTGNIVMISDGNVPNINAFEGNSYSLGDEIKQNFLQQSLTTDRKLITVGVGENTNRQLLERAARNTGGFYLDASQSGRLRFTFDAGGGTKGTNQLVVINNNHFITEDTRLETSTYMFKGISRKEGSKSLVNSISGKPFLTSWRYGIGRVAAFSGGSKDLERTIQTDPELIVRTLAWAVGPRDNEKIEIRSGRRPDTIRIESERKIEGFQKEDNSVFTKTFVPSENGIGEFRGKKYAYNYNNELQQIGYNQENIKKFKRQGFEVFNISEKKSIVEDIKRERQQTTVQQKSLSNYLIGLAILIFLTDVAYRKINGIK